MEKRISDLLKRMTLEEKVAQLSVITSGCILTREGEENVLSEEKAAKVMAHGMGRITIMMGGFSPEGGARMANRIQKYLREKTRLGIPVLFDCEALHGCCLGGSTSFPQAIGLGAMWDPALLEKIGTAIGEEAYARGNQQVLAPVLDLARDVRAGRTEESYGEDPYHVSRMGVAYVKGVQSKRVIATPKHFAANFVGDGGRDSYPIPYSERHLRECCLRPFEAAFKEAGALSVMTSYNSIDGVPCTANRWLLRDLLKNEWGFKGTVVSDWVATILIHEAHRVARNPAEAAQKAIEAGLDVELPETNCFKHLPALVKSGRLSVDVLDDAVRRVLRAKFWAGLFDQPHLNPKAAVRITNCAAHRKLALQAARRSTVLLANDGVLPLKKTLGTVAVIGPSAAVGRLGGYSGGAAVIAPLAGIKALVSKKTRVLFAEGCKIRDVDRSGFAAAVKAARRADVAVLFVGNQSAMTEGEQGDRCNLDLPGAQEDLILEVARANPNVVVVLIGGSAITMGRWLDKVRAVVHGWYPGQEGGTALAEILFGDVSPSGRLPIGIPKFTGQCPLNYDPKPSGRTYDYVDMRGTQAQFPFGHGLGYTTFEYSRLSIRSSGKGKKLALDVSAVISNVGARDGEEVVQLYIRDEYSKLTRPIMELKGFQRVFVKPGQSKVAKFRLTWSDLAYLGADLKPTLEPGSIEIMVGASSSDIRLRGNTTPKNECHAVDYRVSPLLPRTKSIAHTPLPAAGIRFVPLSPTRGFSMCHTDLREVHGGNKDGLIYLRAPLSFARAGAGVLHYGSDGPVKVWVNGKVVGCDPKATNPIIFKYQAPVQWRKGGNEIIFAIHTNGGNAWGVAARGVRGKLDS